MRPSAIVNVMLLNACLWTWRHVDATEALYDTERRLKTALLNNYAKTVPPNASANDTTTVAFGMGIVDIESLDIANEILTTHVWLRMFWEDERLFWDPDQYNGLKVLRLPIDLLWRPDIMPYNRAGDFAYSTEYQAVVTVDKSKQTSSVWYIPHVRLQTSCSVDLYAFPFDTQICSIKLGSWVYSGDLVNLTASESGVDLYDMTANSIWHVVDSSGVVNTKYYPCCTEPYPDFTAMLTLRRLSHLSVHLYVGPAVCIGLSMPVVFLLPAVSTAKLVLGGCLLVAEVLVMNMLSTCIPSTHNTTPVIALYLLGNVVLLCLSLACSAVIIGCWEKAKRAGTGVPAGIDKIFLGVLGRMMCVRREDYMEDDGMSRDVNNVAVEDSATMVKEYTRIVAPAEWRQLSVVLDRLLFCVFSFISILTMAVMVRYSY